MPDEVVSFLNTQAEKDGYSRSDMPLDGDNASELTEEEDEETQMAPMHGLPEWMDLSEHLSNDLADLIPQPAVPRASGSGVTTATVDESGVAEKVRSHTQATEREESQEGPIPEAE